MEFVQAAMTGCKIYIRPDSLSCTCGRGPYAIHTPSCEFADEFRAKIAALPNRAERRRRKRQK